MRIWGYDWFTRGPISLRRPGFRCFRVAISRRPTSFPTPNCTANLLVAWLSASRWRSKQFFALTGTNPINHEIILSNFGDARIIGVAKNTIYKDYRDGGKSLVIYEPFTPSASKSGIGGTGIALRTINDAVVLAPSVYRIAQQIAPRVRANGPLTMEDMVNSDLSQQQATAQIAASSTIIALLTGLPWPSTGCSRTRCISNAPGRSECAWRWEPALATSSAW